MLFFVLKSHANLPQKLLLPKSQNPSLLPLVAAISSNKSSMRMTNQATNLASLSASSATTAIFRKRSNDFLHLARMDIENHALPIIRGNEQVPFTRPHHSGEELAPLHIIPYVRPQHVSRVRHQIRPIAPRDDDHRIRLGMQVHHRMHAFGSNDGILIVHHRGDRRGDGWGDFSDGFRRATVPESYGPVGAGRDDREEASVGAVAGGAVVAAARAAAGHGRGEEDVAAAVDVRIVSAKFL
mmetsp:Transcript_21247/g.44314  ORF Transcript_21247/g.44314 Transcript_21247/m.44314 type:complete len:240 (-) Transcript_21247:1766-2485(-)